MDSPFMTVMAEGLARTGIRVVRFEFPYMRERRHGGKRRPPNSRNTLSRTWHEVVEHLGGAERLVIGGKSLGGRIASMVADAVGARGLVCLGYPFHPPGRPDSLRVAHLSELRTPALIVQGTRDALGSSREIEGYELSDRIRIVFLDDGNHSFKPRVRSGRTEQQALDEAVDAVAQFVRTL
jgi:hypothetical protein